MSRLPSLVILELCLLPMIVAQRSGGGSSSNGGTTYYHSTDDSSSSSSSGGSCSTGCTIGLIVGGIIVVIVAIAWCIYKQSNQPGIFQTYGAGASASASASGRTQQYLHTPAPTVVVSKAGSTSSLRPTSGTWRGAYYGASRLNAGSHIMSIELTFTGTHVQGSRGSDEVGSFTMDGDVRHDNYKIAMVKRYGYEQPVRYQGVFTSSTSMNGTWHTVNGDSGTWNLQCVTPIPATAMVAANQHVIEMTRPVTVTKSKPYSFPRIPDVQHSPSSNSSSLSINAAPEGMPPPIDEPEVPPPPYESSRKVVTFHEEAASTHPSTPSLAPATPPSPSPSPSIPPYGVPSSPPAS